MYIYIHVYIVICQDSEGRWGSITSHSSYECSHSTENPSLSVVVVCGKGNCMSGMAFVFFGQLN